MEWAAGALMGASVVGSHHAGDDSGHTVPDLPTDDPVLEYMLAIAERSFSVTKEDFLPFVPHPLPLVLPKFALTSTECTGGIDGLIAAPISLGGGRLGPVVR